MVHCPIRAGSQKLVSNQLLSNFHVFGKVKIIIAALLAVLGLTYLSSILFTQQKNEPRKKKQDSAHVEQVLEKEGNEPQMSYDQINAGKEEYEEVKDSQNEEIAHEESSELEDVHSVHTLQQSPAQLQNDSGHKSCPNVDKHREANEKSPVSIRELSRDFEINAEIEVLRKERDKLLNELNESQEKVSNLQNELVVVNADRMAQQKEIESLKRDLVNNQEELAMMKNLLLESGEFHEEVSQVKTLREELKIANLQLKATSDELREEIKRHIITQNENQRLKSQNEELIKRYKAISKECEEIKKQPLIIENLFNENGPK